MAAIPRKRSALWTPPAANSGTSSVNSRFKPPIPTNFPDEAIFVASGMLVSELSAETIEKRWRAMLKEHEIEFFKANDCHFLSGPFKKFRDPVKYPKPLGRQAAEKIWNDFESILLSTDWVGFCIGVVMADFKEILRDVPFAKTFWADEPHESGYYAVMYEIALKARRRASGRKVAYMVDQSDVYPRIEAAFRALKKNQPAVAETVERIIPLDDKVTPPLQAADLLASITKDVYFRWLEKGRPRTVPLPKKWRSHFEFIGTLDGPRMFNIILRNLKSKKFREGRLPTRRTKRSRRKGSVR